MSWILCYAFAASVGILWALGSSLLAGLAEGGAALSGDGSVELGDGSVELGDGSVELGDGSAELGDGSVELGDGSVELAQDHGSGSGFPILSPHVLGSFLAGFGLAGWASLRLGATLQTHLPIAIVVGLLSGGLIGSFLQALRGRWSGTSGAGARHLLGARAHLTLAIPKDGSGALHLIAAGTHHTFAARSLTGEVLPAGARVRIERIKSGTAYVSEHPSDRNARLGAVPSIQGSPAATPNKPTP